MTENRNHHPMQYLIVALAKRLTRGQAMSFQEQVDFVCDPERVTDLSLSASIFWHWFVADTLLPTPKSGPAQIAVEQLRLLMRGEKNPSQAFTVVHQQKTQLEQQLRDAGHTMTSPEIVNSALHLTWVNAVYHAIAFTGQIASGRENVPERTAEAVAQACVDLMKAQQGMTTVTQEDWLQRAANTVVNTLNLPEKQPQIQTA